MKENKKSQKQRDLLIAQSNDLVRAKYSTSLWERRLGSLKIFVEKPKLVKKIFKWKTFTRSY